jgi:hypothetical protein
MICLGILPIKASAAVTEDNFQVRTAGDLLELCKATPEDPKYTAAVNFCNGFAVGVYRVLEHENRAATRPLFCEPDRRPSRTEAINAFVQWATAHPAQNNLEPANGLAAYLQQQFPCGGR